MEIISVNVGKSRKIIRNHQERTTGIFKQPADGPVAVTPLGLAGDMIADKEHHGGPDQAIYIYGQADYDWWASELGRQLAPGTFGENLTISGLESAAYHVGDKLLIGEVILQVTSPRMPCATLSARMGDPQFVKMFKAAERPGLYCRVLQTGEVTTGLSVTLEPYQGETVSILETYRYFYAPDKSKAAIQRYLNAPIDVRSRVEMETWLAELDS